MNRTTSNTLFQTSDGEKVSAADALTQTAYELGIGDDSPYARRALKMVERAQETGILTPALVKAMAGGHDFWAVPDESKPVVLTSQQREYLRDLIAVDDGENAPKGVKDSLMAVLA